jgi:hypothetical protein
MENIDKLLLLLAPKWPQSGNLRQYFYSALIGKMGNFNEHPVGISVKVGVEESIVNAPLVSLHSKNTNNAKSEVRFKRFCQSWNSWCVHNRLFNANFDGTLMNT